MSSGNDDLRDIIAAQSKAIQDLTATLLSLTANGKPPRDDGPSPRPMLDMSPVQERVEHRSTSVPRIVQYRIPENFIVGGSSKNREMNIRRAAV